MAIFRPVFRTGEGLKKNNNKEEGKCVMKVRNATFGHGKIRPASGNRRCRGCRCLC